MPFLNVRLKTVFLCENWYISLCNVYKWSGLSRDEIRKLIFTQNILLQFYATFILKLFALLSRTTMDKIYNRQVYKKKMRVFDYLEWILIQLCSLQKRIQYQIPICMAYLLDIHTHTQVSSNFNNNFKR